MNSSFFAGPTNDTLSGVTMHGFNFQSSIGRAKIRRGRTIEGDIYFKNYLKSLDKLECASYRVVNGTSYPISGNCNINVHDINTIWVGYEINIDESYPLVRRNQKNLI